MEQAVDSGETTSVKDTEDSRDYEAEALKVGWQPKEKFRGDESKWVDAKSYVERADTVLPILKAKLRSTEATLAEVQKSAQEFAAHNERAHAREVSEWKAKYEEAVRSKSEAITQGDGAKVIEAEAAIEDLKANRPEPKKEAPKVDPEFKSWLDENPWYGSDDVKTEQANMIGIRLAKKEGLKGRALYDAVAQKMNEYDDVASGKARSGPQRAGKAAAETKGARTYENLKPDARENCDRQFKYFGGKVTEEAWRKSWVSKADEELFRS